MATVYKNWTLDLIPGTNAWRGVALVNGQPMQTPSAITDYAKVVKWIDKYPTPNLVQVYTPPAAAPAVDPYASMVGNPLGPSTSYVPPVTSTDPNVAALQMQVQQQAMQQQALQQQLAMSRAAATTPAPVAPAPASPFLRWSPAAVAVVLGLAGFIWWRTSKSRR